MPRRTSRAKKDTAVADSKNEEETPRRSGRAASKPDSPPKKESSRSRRSSTAAQTAASVIDAKTPRAKVSNQRESTSPVETKTRSRRGGGVESPSARVKSARRSTSKVNYKESDGEEEVSTPKFDDNFVSGEEFDDSESDEKAKPTGRGRSSRATAKGHGTPKSKGKSRSSRGRQSKKKQKDEEEEEEDEEGGTLDVSDENMEKEKPRKSGRGRKQKSETKQEEKPKPSRKSGRSSSSKEDTSSKRPSRGVRAKHYTEDEEAEAEEDEAVEAEAEEDGEEMKDEESGRKRKRDASPEEASKRLKEDDKEDAEAKSLEGIKAEDVKDVEEPMEVEETNSSVVAEAEKAEISETGHLKAEEVTEPVESKVGKSNEEQKENLPLVKKLDDSNEHKMEDSSEGPSAEVTELKKGSSVETPVTDSKDVVKETVSQPEQGEKKDETESSTVLKPSETTKPVVENSPTVAVPISVVPESVPTSAVSETKPVETVDKVELSKDTQMEVKSKVYENDSPASEEGKPLTIDETSPVMSPKETELSTPPANGPQITSDVPSHSVQDKSNISPTKQEKTTPTANGAHNDVQHNNVTPPTDQYCPLPGRKYVSNSKLSENVLQSVKNKTFGFVSYNLGTSHSDGGIQKEKLLNELNLLDARIVCLQHVAKQFYAAVLEPSLDALGFKSVFTQPEDSLKGMATFYKSSLFKLAENSSISLRKLIEKDVETSSLSAEDRNAVKSYVKRCGNVLFAHLSTVIGSQSVTVANVQIPPTDLSVQALQVSCIAREVVRINGGTNKPLLLGGEFNISEKDASYQLLRDGYLSNEMIEELQQRKDIVLPGKENASLVNLLWKSFQHPSSNLCSCYSSVLQQELFIPEFKRTSSDLLWFSSDSLHTVGVLDVDSNKPLDHHFSLKADIAFSV